MYNPKYRLMGKEESAVLRSFTKFLSLFLVLMGFFHNTATAAAARKFPRGCRDHGYEFNTPMLNLKPISESDEIQTVYLIHNKALYPIRLVARRDPKDYTSPPYENIIEGDQWGAFALNHPLLEFKCSTADEGGYPVDCATTLELCQYDRAKFGTSMYGTYWIVQSTQLKEAVKRAIASGILLRW